MPTAPCPPRHARAAWQSLEFVAVLSRICCLHARHRKARANYLWIESNASHRFPAGPGQAPGSSLRRPLSDGSARLTARAALRPSRREQAAAAPVVAAVCFSRPPQPLENTKKTLGAARVPKSSLTNWAHPVKQPFDVPLLHRLRTNENASPQHRFAPPRIPPAHGASFLCRPDRADRPHLVALDGRRAGALRAGLPARHGQDSKGHRSPAAAARPSLFSPFLPSTPVTAFPPIVPG